jgi:uncharacterized protein YhaN
MSEERKAQLRMLNNETALGLTYHSCQELFAELDAQAAENARLTAALEGEKLAFKLAMESRDAKAGRLAVAEAERDTARAECLRLRKVVASDAKLREALQSLCDRLDKVHDDPNYAAVWRVSQIHIGQYTGPTYWNELAAARAALENK